jgi:hypothetical protein
MRRYRQRQCVTVAGTGYRLCAAHHAGASGIDPRGSGSESGDCGGTQAMGVREIVSGPRDVTRLDSLQVLTKWINVTPKAADAQQSDRGARKG